MRRVLLDTPVFLWWLSDDSLLGRKTRRLIADPRHEIFVSAASCWEIAIKKSIGKLEAPDDLDTIVEDEGFLKLPITILDGEVAGSLPPHHRDPFDRMLVAQSMVNALSLMTNDARIRQYAVKILDPLQ